ncbi:hypothetical protein SAMN05518856_11895 [Paenibacillus sp. OK003]|nr:hypothetical protein SAMN05518856_11895 [Paenibacillus sp. OK003]
MLLPVRCYGYKYDAFFHLSFHKMIKLVIEF